MIKPCPFCGTESKIENTVLEMTIRCQSPGCRATMKFPKMTIDRDSYFKTQLTDRWNRRIKIGEKK